MQHEEKEQFLPVDNLEAALEKKKIIQAVIDVCGPDLAEKVVAKDLMNGGGITDDEETNSIVTSVLAKLIVDEYKAEKRD